MAGDSDMPYVHQVTEKLWAHAGIKVWWSLRVGSTNWHPAKWSNHQPRKLHSAQPPHCRLKLCCAEATQKDAWNIPIQKERLPIQSCCKVLLNRQREHAICDLLQLLMNIHFLVWLDRLWKVASGQLQVIWWLPGTSCQKGVSKWAWTSVI